MRWIANPLYVNLAYRGFESPPLRHIEYRGRWVGDWLGEQADLCMTPSSQEAQAVVHGCC